MVLDVDMLSKNYSLTSIKKYLFFAIWAFLKDFLIYTFSHHYIEEVTYYCPQPFSLEEKSVACISEPRAISTYIGKSYVGLIAKMIVLFLTFDTYGWEVWTFLRAWALLYSVKSISRFLSYREDHFVDWQSAAAHEN